MKLLLGFAQLDDDQHRIRAEPPSPSRRSSLSGDFLHELVELTDPLRPLFRLVESAGAAVDDDRSVPRWLERLRELSDAEFDLRADELEPVRPLGAGTFATVQLCRLQADDSERGQRLRERFPGQLVALKRSRGAGAVPADSIELVLRVEGALLKWHSHPNIVGSIGCLPASRVSSNGTGVVLVEEYLPGGTLRDQLRLRAFTRAQALDWLMDVACGLRALHEGPVCVAHRDLKPENIMLAANGTAKLVDLGLARMMHASEHDPHTLPAALDSAESNAPNLSDVRLTLLTRADATESTRHPDFVYTDRTGSERYMAPENFLGGAYDHRVDVFSFAVLAYELMSVGRAYEELYLTPEQIGRDVAERGLRPSLPPHWPSAFATLLKRCWAHEPSARPEMRDIYAELVAFRNLHDAAKMELLFSSPSALNGFRAACESSCPCTIA